MAFLYGLANILTWWVLHTYQPEKNQILVWFGVDGTNSFGCQSQDAKPFLGHLIVTDLPDLTVLIAHFALAPIGLHKSTGLQDRLWGALHGHATAAILPMKGGHHLQVRVKGLLADLRCFFNQLISIKPGFSAGQQKCHLQGISNAPLPLQGGIVA